MNFSSQYKDVFLGTDNVGNDFKRNPPWGNGQPKGGIIQNCVATRRSHLWTSDPCHRENCVSCLIKINQEYKLRGLCKDTLFDNRFKLIGTDPLTKKLHFIGINGWTIKYDFESKGFVLSNSKIVQPYAAFNDTQHYPMGLKQWWVNFSFPSIFTASPHYTAFSKITVFKYSRVVDGKNDNCPTLKRYKFLFTSCSLGQFTCNDGSCIDIHKRCNKISDCSDDSDEFDCYKVQVSDSYNKFLAPVEKSPNLEEDERVKITIQIHDFEIVDIDYLQSQFIAKFHFHMTWIDGRLQFLNLREYEKNLLDQNESGNYLPIVNTIYSPLLTQVFQNSENYINRGLPVFY